MKVPYRGVVDLLEEMPWVRQMIGLETVPHFAILQKFFDRINGNQLFLSILSAAESFEVAAVDSSGFSSYASKYYEERVNEGIWKRNFKKIQPQ